MCTHVCVCVCDRSGKVGSSDTRPLYSLDFVLHALVYTDVIGEQQLAEVDTSWEQQLKAGRSGLAFESRTGHTRLVLTRPTCYNCCGTTGSQTATFADKLLKVATVMKAMSLCA